MKITIHQPDYIPWLGFFLRWQAADKFVILDDVQFLRQGWHHRDKVLGPDGRSIWLTVPVKKKGRSRQSIRDVEIDNSTPWWRKHLGTLRATYVKAPYFNAYWNDLEYIYLKNHNSLMSLNIDLLLFGAKVLGVATPLCYSSMFGIEATSTKRLVELVKTLQGTEYLTGLGAKEYLDEESFNKDGIQVKWHRPVIPEYKQLVSPFVSGLSFLDYLFMVGKTLDEYTEKL
jgi:hypothetical protein